MCLKSYFKEIVLKLATNGQSDKGFLLTSIFVPKGLSATALRLYTCIKALEYIPGPGVRWAFTGPLVLWFVRNLHNWASTWDYGTYHIGDQRRLRRACISAQSRQSLRCLHTCSMEVDRGCNQKIRHLAAWMAAHVRLKNELTENKKYHNLMSWFNWFT